MKVYFWAILSIFSFFSFPVEAQVCGEDCTTPPTCSQLGYKKGLTCPEGGIICPFDASYKWCKEYTCDDGRYYSSPLAGDYTCAKVEYHGLTCYDCVATAEEVSCSVTDEQSLVAALESDDCPVVTVLNNITITNSLPDMKPGQTLKAADGSTYTIEVKPTGNIDATDREVTINGVKNKLSSILGTKTPGVVLATSDQNIIQDLRFFVYDNQSINAVFFIGGKTRFDNLQLYISGDGSNYDSSDVMAGFIGFDTDLIFSNNVLMDIYYISHHTVAAIYGNMDITCNDSFDLSQRYVRSRYLQGLILDIGSFTVNGDVSIIQEMNSEQENIYALLNGNRFVVSGDVVITQNQNSNVISQIYGLWYGGSGNQSIFQVGGLYILQEGNSTRAIAGMLYFNENGNISIGNEIQILQRNNQAELLTGASTGPAISLTGTNSSFSVVQSGNTITGDPSNENLIGLSDVKLSAVMKNTPLSVTQNNNENANILGLNVVTLENIMATITQTNNKTCEVVSDKDTRTLSSSVSINQSNNT